MSGRYHGQPMAKHLPLSVDARDFDRWLTLFAETAREVCPQRLQNVLSFCRIGSGNAELTNYLVAAYCPVVNRNSALFDKEKEQR